jgi:flagellar basal-body rod modification protein FlgD
MQVNSVTATANASTTGATDTVAGADQVLSQKDFLQLLVAQMQNQNPLNPQSDTQMAAEMAQFAALQQSSDMASSLSMMQAGSLVGNTVTLQVDAKTITSGVVQGVVLQNNKPQLLVNGATYDLSQVVAVTPTVADPTTGSTAQ